MKGKKVIKNICGIINQRGIKKIKNERVMLDHN